MTKCTDWFEQNSQWSMMPLRIILGILFLMAGIGKLFIMKIPAVSTMFTGLGIPLATFFAWLVAIIELVGGIFLILGMFVRHSAILLSIIMVVALLTAHLNSSYATALVPLAGTLALLFGGSGPLALDETLCKKHKK